MRNHLEHPYPSHRQNLVQPTQTFYPVQRALPARPFHSPVPYIPSQPLRQQRKFSFTHQSASSTPFSAYNPNAPAFRELRQRYIKSISTPVMQQRQSQTFRLHIPESFTERVQGYKKEQPKSEKIKTTFASPPGISMDKKLNMTEASSQAKTEKVKSITSRMQSIMEQLPSLQQSKALYSQIAFFKRRFNQLQDQNNNLKATIFNQQVKITTDQENYQKEEQKLIQEVKSLKIELKKNENETMMARISEAEMAKKCRRMAEKYREQQKEIARLKEQVGEQYSERGSTTKSQTGYYILP